MQLKMIDQLKCDYTLVTVFMLEFFSVIQLRFLQFCRFYYNNLPLLKIAVVGGGS